MQVLMYDGDAAGGNFGPGRPRGPGAGRETLVRRRANGRVVCVRSFSSRCSEVKCRESL